MAKKVKRKFKLMTMSIIIALIEAKAMYKGFSIRFEAKCHDSKMRLHINFIKFSISIQIGIP